jgi:hypothetical protein
VSNHMELALQDLASPIDFDNEASNLLRLAHTSRSPASSASPRTLWRFRMVDQPIRVPVDS